jgi:LmbE family N-acetylglucosaminyl deacetylase
MFYTSGALVSVALMLSAFPALSAERAPSGAELMRALDRLSVVGNVLYVAAHPDDENTRMLAWLVHGKKVRAGYLSLTRGEGGQNLIGRDLSPLLGVIRTDELLAARALDGAEQWFTRARDFGYSKNPEETLAIWDHEAILSDVVWVIRRFRPDVIVTRFSPFRRDTHGHHTASAQLAVEAFSAAADPRRFPEQLQRGVSPWQAKRIVWNRSNFGSMTPTAAELPKLITHDVGGYDPLLGVSYGELAADSRSMHKSQGFGVAKSRGESLEYFEGLGGAAAKHSIFDDIDLGWSRVPGGARIGAEIGKIRAAFRVEAPHESVPALLKLRAAIDALPDSVYKQQKLEEVSNLIVGALGLFAEANVSDSVGVPGDPVTIKLTALNRSPIPVTLKNLQWPDGVLARVVEPLTRNQPREFTRDLELKIEQSYSQPYWLAHLPERGHWTVPDPNLIGQPAAPPLEVGFVFEIGSQALGVRRPLVYKWVDPVAGERQRAFEVLPPVTVNPRTRLLVFGHAAPKPLVVALQAHRDEVHGELTPALPSGWRVEPGTQHFDLRQKGDEVELIFRVVPPAAESTASARLIAKLDSLEIARGLVQLEYPHIPIETLTPEAEVKLVRVDVRHEKTRIGYIPGAGDEVAEALRQIGYDVTLLTNEDLAHAPLSAFQAIVAGVRAFNVNERLGALHDRLMDYVAGGGTLLVQYNTNNQLSKVPQTIGPEPFKITQRRVTDENAAVEFLDPHHPFLNKPNRLGPRDFADWVQERGLYFASDFGEAYQPLFTMHDVGEAPNRGSLLVARHGKGVFVYTGLALFRQLPAGIAGAYRLIANLLDHGSH